MVVDVETKLAALLRNLLEGELGHVLGDHERPALLDVGPRVDDVDLLELAAGRLDVEEPAERDGEQVDQREEQVHAPPAGGREHGREHDHGEVADPVGARRRGGAGGTRAQRVDLGRVDPRERQEREGEEGDEEEDADDGALGVLLGRVDQAGERDDKRQALAEEADQVQVAAADLFDHEERRDGGEGVDGRKDAAHDQSHAVLQAQVVLKEQGRVVDGGVAARELLEELAGAADHGALELLGLAAGEERLPAGLLGDGGLHVGLHEVEVGEHVVRVGRRALELGQDLARLLVVASHDEPAGGVGEHHGAERHDDGEEDLERDGEAPLHALLDVRETEHDPVGDKRANGDDGALEADQETTVVRAGALGLPHGDGGRVHAVSKTRHDAANDELTQAPVRSERSARDDGANNKHRSSKENKTGTADPVTEEHREQSTEEAADLVASRDGATEHVDVTVDVGGRVLGEVQHGEGLCELGSGDEPRHHALVVAKEREAHDGRQGDAHLEHAPRRARGRGPHTELLYGKREEKKKKSGEEKVGNIRGME